MSLNVQEVYDRLANIRELSDGLSVELKTQIEEVCKDERLAKIRKGVVKDSLTKCYSVWLSNRELYQVLLFENAKLIGEYEAKLAQFRAREGRRVDIENTEWDLSQAKHLVNFLVGVFEEGKKPTPEELIQVDPFESPSRYCPFCFTVGYVFSHALELIEYASEIDLNVYKYLSCTNLEKRELRGDSEFY